MTLFDNDTCRSGLSLGGSGVRSFSRRTTTATSWQFLDDDRWEVTASTLTPREDTYSLHIGFRRHPTGVEREVLTDQPAEHGRCSGWTSA